MRWTVLLAAATLFAQEKPAQDDLQNLIEQLDADTADARDAAMKELIKRWENPQVRKAVEELCARSKANPEVLWRAKNILAEISRFQSERAEEVKQRPRKLRLVTLDFRDAPLSQILEELTRQTGVTFAPAKIDTARRLSAQAKESPLLKVLNDLGLEPVNLRDKFELKSLKSLDGPIYFAGGRLEFWTQPWEPKKKFAGTIVRISSFVDAPYDLGCWNLNSPEMPPDLRWNIVKIEADALVKFETCAVHSPWAVFVPERTLSGAHVTVEGVRTWYCDYAIEFRDPRDGDQKRVGGFLVEIRWPNVVVRPDKETDEAVLSRTLIRGDVKTTLRPGIQPVYGGRYGFRRGGKELLANRGGGDFAWCGCRDHPSKEPKPKSPTATEHSVEAGLEHNDLEDVESITVTFHKPVEEKFTVTSPPLK